MMKRWIAIVLILSSLSAYADVRNPVVFVGERFLNGITGTPVSTDVNNGLQSGLSSDEVSATTTTTTTSTTDVLMNSMTIRPGAGTYLVWYSTTVTCPSLGATVTSSLYVNGSQLARTERHFQVSVTGALGLGGNSDGVLAGQTKVTIAANQDLEVRWRTSTGTASGFQRTLTILRVL